MLRRAGVVAAGATGAAVLAESPASAAPGGPVVIGQSNDAGATTTLLSGGTSLNGALKLANPSGPTLRLEPTPFEEQPEAPLGAMWVDPDGDLAYITDFGNLDDGSLLGPTWAHNSRWATMPIATKPTRVLDTRSASGRANVVAGSGSIDSAGRLGAGRTIVVSLDAYVNLGAAVHATLTVAQTTGGGYVTIWGIGPRPTASNINWWGSNQAISNGTLTALGTYGTRRSVIAIYTSSPAAVILDVTAFDVGGPWQVTSSILASSTRNANTPGTRTASRPPGPRALQI